MKRMMFQLNSDSFDELNFTTNGSIICKSNMKDYKHSGCDADDNNNNNNSNNNDNMSSHDNGDNDDDVNFPVWVAFRQGYVSGKFLTSLPNGRCRVLILPGQEVIEVNTEVVERANPSSMDRVDDLIKLRYANESSVTHSFIQRYGSGLIFTYASGINLISINPMMPLNIYSDKVMDLFTDCEVRYDMPPHVYSVAQLILARLKRRLFYTHLTIEEHLNNDPVYSLPYSISQQVLCLLGRSGSGKTRVSNDVLTYMIYQSEKSIQKRNHSNGNNNNNNNNDSNDVLSSKINASRLRALFNLLDSFTCSRIVLNTNGSRALRIFSLEFAKINSLPIVNQPEDIGLMITGLTTRLLLFERSRVTDRPEIEPNFHIFYYLLAGLDDESRRELFLTDLDAPNLFMTRLQRPEDKESAKIYWNQLCRDAEQLEFNIKEEWLTGGLARLLAVIYHLGCAGYCHQDVVNRRDSVFIYFTNYEAAQRAAHLLNCSLETLNQLIFEPFLRKIVRNGGGGGVHHDVGGDDDNDDQYSLNWTIKDCLYGFVQELYHLVVDILVCLINRCLSTPKSDMPNKLKVAAQLILVDPVGLQIPHSTSMPPSSSGSPGTENSENQKSGNFPDLIFNYAYERLSQLYFDSTIMLDEQRLKHDGLTSPVPYENFCRTKNILNFIDNTSFIKNPNIYSTKNATANNNNSNNNNEMCNFMFPGLFSLLDSISQNGELSQLSDLLSHMYQIQRKQHENRDLRIIRRFKRAESSFVLNHNLSTTPIQYTPAHNWFAPYHRSNCRRKLIYLLGQSPLPSLRNLVSMLDCKEDYLSSFIPSNRSHIGVCSDVKSTMDTLIRSLYDCAAHNASYNPNDPGSGFNDGGPPSGMHWIHCFLPVSTAGLCQLNEEIPIDQLILKNSSSEDYTTSTTTSTTHNNNNNSDNHTDSNHMLNEMHHNKSTSYLHELMKRYPNKNLVFSPARICVNLIRSQIRGIELISTLQSVKLSYPDRLSLKEFRNRFIGLLPVDSKLNTSDYHGSLDRVVANEILNSLHYAPETYQLGSSNIYLRTFIIPQLVHRLASSAGLSSEQELIQVQIACQSYITDYCEEPRISANSVSPYSVSKQPSKAGALRKSLDIHEIQTAGSPVDFISPRQKEIIMNGRASVPVMKSEDNNTLDNKKSNEDIESIAIEREVHSAHGYEENEKAKKVMEKTSTELNKEITLNRRGKVSVSISREMNDSEPWIAGSTILYGSSETIKRDEQNSETAKEITLKPNTSSVMEKEIYLSSKPPSQSSLNITFDSERKVNIQPVSASFESVKNDLDSQEKEKENNRKKVQNKGSFSSDYEDEIQTNNEHTNHTTLSPLQLKAQLKESEDELRQYKIRYTEALKSIEDLKSSSNDLTVQLSSLTTENVRYKQDCDRARADLELAEENRLQAEQLVKVITAKLELAEKRHLLLLESVKKTQEKDDGEPSSTKDYALLYPNAPEDLLTLVNKLRSTNHSLMLQITDLQNALDNLKKELESTHASQLKAEKTIEKLRADLIRVQDEHETDYEAMRSANQVKLRQLEEKLESIQQENARLNREKHQLELEISVLNTELANAATSNDDDIERKLLKELKIMKNLLTEKDVIILQLTSNSDDYKEQIRKLRDRIDELDESNEKTNRQKRRLQSDLEETQQQLTSALRTQKRFEEELSRLRRELNELENQLADQEDAHKETRDKLTAALADITVKEATIQAQMEEINAFLIERKKLQTQIDELKLEINTTSMDQVPRSELDRLEARIRELDQRLDSEITNRTRIQYSLDRAKESVEQLTNERDKLISSEANIREQNRKLSRQLRLAQQEESEATRKATIAQRRVEEAQFDVNKALDDAACSRAEMTALQRRIQDLEAYINKAKHLKLDGEDDDDDDELGLYDSSADDIIGLRKLKGSQDLLLRSTLSQSYSRSSAEYSVYGCCSDAEDGVNGVGIGDGVGDGNGDMPNNHENNHCMTETNESKCPTVTTTTTNNNNSSINTNNNNTNNDITIDGL
uniref:Myosin motor domain-containing protein n=1 Tax=Trichobilharzia regenti TaxID=157069 RepID=A0AA85KHC9_TRIRE|nr:unnamed protein product [Trichobilharzia regenti]